MAIYAPSKTPNASIESTESQSTGPDARQLKQAIGRAGSLLAETESQGRRLVLNKLSKTQGSSFFESFIHSASEKRVGSGFAITCERLQSLLQEQDEDEPKPSFYSYAYAWKLILEAEQFLSIDFPRAVVSTDEDGGIRFRWRTLTLGREVRLYCTPVKNKKPYIYHEVGDEYGSEDAASGQVLAKWLNWLIGS